jgi:6-phosphofructokinase 1
MNPCVRAVVRAAVYHGIEAFAVRRGYQGMIEDDIHPLGVRSVSNIISRGGTILKTSRSDEFRQPEGRAKAVKNLEKHGIEGLVVIGGDGSFHGAHCLAEESAIKVVGVPGTIDNDIAGTDYTIGYDTALNVAMEALDKIRDTAGSHDRLFFVEAMGRHAGFLALEAGIAAGAEDVLIPETPTEVDDVVAKLRAGREQGKTSFIVVVAEGDDAGGAFKVAEQVSEKVGIKSRVTILGHLQRGGSPTAYERVQASRLGVAAVRELAAGKSDIMVGIIGEEVVTNRLERSWTGRKGVSAELLELNEILAI